MFNTGTIARGPFPRRWRLVNKSAETGDQDAIWSSRSLDTFPREATRNPYDIAQEMVSATSTLVILHADGTLEVMAKPLPESGTITPVIVTPPDARPKIKAIGQNVVLFAGSDDTFYLSTDGGFTFTDRTPVPGLILAGIDRLTSGRWVGFFQNGPTQRLYYSDSADMSDWTQASISAGAPSVFDLISFGTGAVAFNTSGTVFRTTDGSGWTALPSVLPGNFGSPTTQINGVFTGGAIVIQDGDSESSVWVSHDEGFTWGAVTMPSTSPLNSTAYQISYGDGVVSVALGTSELFRSGDDGATFTKVDLSSTPLITPLVAHL